MGTQHFPAIIFYHFRWAGTGHSLEGWDARRCFKSELDVKLNLIFNEDGKALYFLNHGCKQFKNCLRVYRSPNRCEEITQKIFLSEICP